MIIKSEVQEVISVLVKLKIPFYINAGFALNLMGFESELDDCDIRIFHTNLDEVYNYLKKHLSYEIKLRGPMYYNNGLYDTKCIELWDNNEKKFDIYNQMIVECDIGRFEFPFNLDVFSEVSFFSYKNIMLPVATIENLFLYYLILRRTSIDGKNDAKRVIDILVSKEFEEYKFFELIKNHKLKEKILKLYDEIKKEIMINKI